jgi:hypothetical protein
VARPQYHLVAPFPSQKLDAALGVSVIIDDSRRHHRVYSRRPGAQESALWKME